MAPGADVLQRLLARARKELTVSYDPNCRPLLMGSPDAVRGRIEALVGLADVVKASADDLAWLLPDRAPEQVAESWLAKGPSAWWRSPSARPAWWPRPARPGSCAAPAASSPSSTPSEPATPA